MSDDKPRRLARGMPSASQETAAAIVPEAEAGMAENAVRPIPSVAPFAPPSPEPLRSAAVEGPWSGVADLHTVLANSAEEAAAELTGLARSGLMVSGEALIALIGARTFSEVAEINAKAARRSFDAVIGGSTRLSDITIKAFAATTGSFLAQRPAG